MEADFQASEFFPATGVTEDQIEELKEYTDSRFEVSALGSDTVLPLSDEPFVACWESWIAEADEHGAWTVLSRRLPQIAFPVREGMSREDAYRAATLRGVPVSELPAAVGLDVPHPENVEITLHASPAGRIPVLTCRGRDEFAALVRALARRNEPAEVPASMGALMISGYNNWHRLGALRAQWEVTPPEARETETWNAEMQRLQRDHKDLYQDRMILLTDGPYSAVPAAEVGLDEDAWRERSLVLRRDHECAHYFTRRLFGSMRLNLHDELLADYAGLVAAFGRFEAALFLRLLGVAPDGELLPGARAPIYRGKPALSDGAFGVALDLVRRAAENVETFDADFPEERTLADRAQALTAIAALRLEALAAPDGDDRLRTALAEVRRRVDPRHDPLSGLE